VYSLPPGPIWLLHTFYLVSSALMLGWYLRYGPRQPAHSAAARMGGSPDAERAGADHVKPGDEVFGHVLLTPPVQAGAIAERAVRPARDISHPVASCWDRGHDSSPGAGRGGEADGDRGHRWPVRPPPGRGRACRPLGDGASPVQPLAQQLGGLVARYAAHRPGLGDRLRSRPRDRRAEPVRPTS